MFDEATFIKGAAEWGQLPDDGRSEIAFIGRSNVGKSSLINAVLGRKSLAYTSKSPGKTRQFNYFLVDGRFYIVDLPGYGYATGSRSERDAWERLRQRYLSERRWLRGVVQLVDARHPAMDNDAVEIERLAELNRPSVVVLTKGDKLSGNGRAEAKRQLKSHLADLDVDCQVVLTSSETGRGITTLRTWIGTVVDDARSEDSSGEPSWMDRDVD